MNVCVFVCVSVEVYVGERDSVSISVCVFECVWVCLCVGVERSFSMRKDSRYTKGVNIVLVYMYSLLSPCLKILWGQSHGIIL